MLDIVKGQRAGGYGLIGVFLRDEEIRDLQNAGELEPDDVSGSFGLWRGGPCVFRRPDSLADLPDDMNINTYKGLLYSYYPGIGAIVSDYWMDMEV